MSAAPDPGVTLVPDAAEAARLLDLLVDDDSVITFQTFPERAGRGATARIRHSTLAKQEQWLLAQNRAGSGVFFMVNRGDGHGRSAKNVVGVRTLFLDLDGAPLDGVSKAAPA